MKLPLDRCFVVASGIVLLTTVSQAAVPPGPGEDVMRPVAPGRVVVHYANALAIDVAKILPPPPAAGSLAALADLESVLAAQTWSTAEHLEWARTVERDHVFNNVAIVGLWFTEKNLPITTAFFKNLGEDIRTLDGVAKKPFLRPRPSEVDSRVEPCVTVPATTSYPSGSALQAFVWAALLGEIFPEKRADLESRAYRAAWGRVIGGVHFPSDLVAGRMLADAFLTECRKSGAFRDAFDLSWREMMVWAKTP